MDSNVQTVSASSNDLMRLAINQYGLTNNIKDAGYILPDGSLLDFNRNSSGIDHRNIAIIYNENGIPIWSDEYRYNYCVDFMNHGAIRCDVNEGLLDMTMEPTSKQCQILKQFVRIAGDVDIDFTDEKGDTIHSVSYEDAQPGRVVADILRFYEEGIRPEGNIRLENIDAITDIIAEAVTKKLRREDKRKMSKDIRTVIREEITRLLTEDEEMMYSYYDKYNEWYILDMFANRTTERMHWNLIKPSMYKKALEEFTRTGRISTFPERYIYQWIGIILRNTCYINAITILAGHADYSPDYDSIESPMDQILRPFGMSVVESDRDMVLNLSEEALRMVLRYKDNVFIEGKRLNEESMHSDGQLNAIYTQKETGQFDRNEAISRKCNPEVVKAIEEHNKDNASMTISISKDGDFLGTIDFYELLDELEFFDWAVLPDGGDAFSDYGLQPLFNVCLEYNEDSTPEETLVIINKALDIYHQRSDLAAAFIEGGSSSLTAISESIRRNKRRLIEARRRTH